MQKYILSEQDIRVLIGVAADEFCEENASPEGDDSVMNIAAEIAARILGHLSGERKFPEEAIRFLRMVDDQLIENAPVTEAATSGRTDKNTTIF